MGVKTNKKTEKDYIFGYCFIFKSKIGFFNNFASLLNKKYIFKNMFDEVFKDT